MSIEAIVALFAGMMTIANAVLVIIMRGVTSELRTIRAEVRGEFEKVLGTIAVIQERMNGNVIERLVRVETEIADLGAWRRDVEHHMAQLPRRSNDRQEG